MFKHKPRVPFDPATKIQLNVNVNGQTMKHNIKRTLRKIIHLPALQKYYEHQLDWFSTTFDTVDWDIFRLVYMKRARKNLQWINKYCLRNLATGKRMNQQSGTDDERCCSCGAALEDDAHLFQCKDRPQFLQQLTKELIKYDQELDPKLLHLLIDGISIYVHGEIPPSIHTCQVMEQLGPTQNTNNINPYVI